MTIFSIYLIIAVTAFVILVASEKSVKGTVTIGNILEALCISAIPVINLFLIIGALLYYVGSSKILNKKVF